MIIAFDAKRAFRNQTGLGNYSRYVIEQMVSAYPQHTYLLYTPKDKPCAAMTALLHRFPDLQVKVPTSPFWSKLSSLWRVFGLAKELRADGVDVFHGLSNELPVGIHRTGIRSIVTIHDLIFLRFPQYYKLVDRLIYRWKFSYACRHADCIIAVSQCTKQDIVHDFGTPADKIRVVYQGCDAVFATRPSPAVLQQVRDKYHLPDRFILNVGSIEARKNALLIVKAVEQCADVQGVIVGKRTAYTHRLEAYLSEHPALQSRVRLLHGVPFADLHALYGLAETFVYPSRYEGFGIPILEALTAGLPVVAATGSCLEEAGGEDSIYVAPDDVEALRHALQRLHDDEDLRKSMADAGKKYAQQFDSKRQAREIMGTYCSHSCVPYIAE